MNWIHGKKDPTNKMKYKSNIQKLNINKIPELRMRVHNGYIVPNDAFLIYT